MVRILAEVIALASTETKQNYVFKTLCETI